MDWLVEYFVEDSEFNNYVMKQGGKLRKHRCKICERVVAVPEDLPDYLNYVCVCCSDDAVHDYVKRGH